MIDLPRPCICLITDRHRLTPDARTERDELVALERLVVDACESEIDLIQLREKDLDARAYAALLVRVMSRAPAGARLVVNDRVDVAHAAGAAGVHLPADAPSAGRVRALWPGSIIGRSVHSAHEVAEFAEVTEDRRPDYLIFGTVFSTASKPAGSPAARLNSEHGIRLEWTNLFRQDIDDFPEAGLILQ